MSGGYQTHNLVNFKVLPMVDQSLTDISLERLKAANVRAGGVIADRVLSVPVYTIANKPTTYPEIGICRIITISDSKTHGGKQVDGMIAFWDTTNNRWAYMMDNSPV